MSAALRLKIYRTAWLAILCASFELVAFVWLLPKPVKEIHVPIGFTAMAKSLSLHDVSAAVNRFKSGHTVLLPAGTGDWSGGTLHITNRVMLVGAGQNKTVFRHECTNGPQFLFHGGMPGTNTYGLGHVTVIGK